MPRSTWFALIAPPLAWFTALTAGYFMVGWACGSGLGAAVLHAVLAGMLLTGVAATLAGVRSWQRAGREWPGEGPDPLTRTRFLSVVASFGGVVFSIAILWSWLAVAALDPCEPGPRLPFAPSAMASSSSVCVPNVRSARSRMSARPGSGGARSRFEACVLPLHLDTKATVRRAGRGRGGNSSSNAELLWRPPRQLRSG